MSELRKLEILLTSGYTDHLTDVRRISCDGDWVYVYQTEDINVTYRAEGIVRINSLPMVYD